MMNWASENDKSNFVSSVQRISINTFLHNPPSSIILLPRELILRYPTEGLFGYFFHSFHILLRCCSKFSHFWYCYLSHLSWLSDCCSGNDFLHAFNCSFSCLGPILMTGLKLKHWCTKKFVFFAYKLSYNK